MKTHSNFYVYGYFDPRNYEMFYVGKGQGSRKDAHKPDKAGSRIQRRIHEIQKAGQKPLIKIIAADLAEDQAYLVEKALIWRSGAWLTNVSPGRYADNFRPPNTLHLTLPGFDFTRGIYIANLGKNWEHRRWEDCRKYGFWAAGYGRQYGDQLYRLEVGSIAVGYLRSYGYVGIGQVLSKPVPSREFRYRGKPLRAKMLVGPDLLHNARDYDECEYLVAMKWIKSVPLKDARFRRKAGLFTTQHIVASLAGQPRTLKFLEKEFNVNFEKLLSAE